MEARKIKSVFLIFSLIPIFLLIFSFEKYIISLLLLYQIISSLNLKEISLIELDHLVSMFLLTFFVLNSIVYLLFYFGFVKIKLMERIIKKFSSSSKEFLSGFLMIILILFITLNAPLMSPIDPNFSKDVSITKLLPPLSVMNYIQLKLNKYSTIEKNLIQNKLLENFDEERRIYFTDLEIKDSSLIIHKERTKEIFNIKEIETLNDKPVIKSQIFILGTDEFGRDLLSRLIYSIRLSVFIAVFSVLISFLLGSTIGYIAGIFGGLVDSLLMRLVDFFLSFPILFFVIFLIAFVGNSILLLVIVFGFSGWMYVARLARNETIVCMKKEFIQTLILMGQTKFKIIIKHILPNTFSPILITLIFLMSNVIIAESALSFIGLGIQPPTPTLGGIIKSGYDYLSINGWIAFSASLTLVIIVMTFNLFAEGIRKISRN